MTCHVEKVFLHVCGYQCCSVNASLAADGTTRPKAADAVCRLYRSLDCCTFFTFFFPVMFYLIKWKVAVEEKA